jgi:protein-tyrosine phosphatase
LDRIKTRVSFVCLGNICRSPLAEGVFKHIVQEANLADSFEIESAGVGGWHAGEPADSRAQQTALEHGLRLTGKAQQFRARDFDRLDWVIALDSAVADDLRRLAPNQSARDKIRLLRESDPQRRRQSGEDLDVPDPYYGGSEGFEDAFQMIERSSRQLFEEIRPDQGGDRDER